MKLWRTLAPLSLTVLTSFLVSQASAQIWTQDGTPSRFSHTAVFDPATKRMYDPVSNEMITFGGASNSTPLTPEADVYTLTNANGLPPRK